MTTPSAPAAATTQTRAGTFVSALGETKYAVILPGDYDAPARAAVRYPVVYLLHGIGGHEDEWLKGSRIAQDAAGRETILICADAGPLCYVDSHDGASLCETMVARDLVAFADQTYRTIDRPHARGLMGLSMGGYGALYLSLRHPHVFSAAVAYSGALHIGTGRFAERRPERAHLDALWPATLSGREPWDLFAQLRCAPPHVRRDLCWRLVCGTEDRLIHINRAFHHYLLSWGVEHEYAEYPGGHTWGFWDEQAVAGLDFLTRHLTPRADTLHFRQRGT